MHKNCFVGGGLSAYFSQLLHWQKGDVCLYPSASWSPYAVKRPHLEINKFFSSQSCSYGSNLFQLSHAELHDRGVLGGNSEIWGGFFDAARVERLDKLKDAGIQFVPLSFGATGSASNITSLVQLQESNGKILNASNHLRSGDNKYLDSIRCEPGRITLNCLSADKPEPSQVVIAGKVFVCTGVVQTIDLLMRSQLINQGDELTLDEFEYELVIGRQPSSADVRDACVITYTPGRAIAHLLGIQKGHRLATLKPFEIHQVFHARTQTLHMTAGSHVLSGAPDAIAGRKPKKFGQSIHYCNLKINGERLVDMAARLNTNLHFVSMASVVQSKPGPISSDIFAYLESIPNEL